MSPGGPLAGLGVLVTRPAAQAGGLCQLIEQHGGTAHRFPVLEILPPADPEPLRAAGERLHRYDWAVFISANAVERALEAILAVRTWPSSTRIAVIGRSSAQALERFQLRADLCPSERMDSEGLLALPALQQVQGSHWVIFRGGAGRAHLGDSLRARGARADYVEAYRRARPRADAAPLLARWQRGEIQVVVVNSVESLHNLMVMLGPQGAALLRETPLLVVSERLRAEVEEQGFGRSLLAANATDTAVVESLLAWHAGERLRAPPPR